MERIRAASEIAGVDPELLFYHSVAHNRLTEEGETAEFRAQITCIPPGLVLRSHQTSFFTGGACEAPAPEGFRDVTTPDGNLTREVIYREMRSRHGLSTEPDTFFSVASD